MNPGEGWVILQDWNNNSREGWVINELPPTLKRNSNAYD